MFPKTNTTVEKKHLSIEIEYLVTLRNDRTNLWMKQKSNVTTYHLVLDTMQQVKMKFIDVIEESHKNGTTP